MKKLLVIVGPTGSGKTDLAVSLAQKHGVASPESTLPILSADSRQIYIGMPIGTAQPSADQLAAAEHHFIAELPPEADFSCGAYEAAALDRLERIFARTNRAIAVGGSGLYIRALCEGLDEMPAADKKIRTELTQRLETDGLVKLTEELKQRDPAHHAAVDLRNPARVIRALEVCLSTGRPYSEFRLGALKKRPFEVIKLGVDLPRAELYARIDARVEGMLSAGLVEEARALYPRRALGALRTVGYRELFDHFDGRTTLEEAVELIKRNTRRYAKRQLTWLRREDDIFWVHSEREDEIFDYLCDRGFAETAL